MRKANIVVVGAGNIGLAHIAVVDGLENANLYGICDTRPVGEEIAAEYQTKYFKSVDEVCQDDEVDGAVVCVPDAFHKDVCIQLGKAGKHVLVEKPIAPTVKEAEEMLQVFQENNLVLAVAQCTAFISPNVVGKQDYEAGKIGEAVHFSVRHQVDWGCGFDVKDRAHVMFYIGIHDIFSIMFITGLRIKSVYSKAVSKIMGDAHDGIATVFTMDNGATGCLEVGWYICPPHLPDIMEFEIFGTKGTMINDYKKAGLRVCDETIAKNRDLYYLYASDYGLRGALAEEVRSFVECIFDGDRKYEVDNELATYCVKVIEAIFQSVETGQEIQI